MARSEQQHLVDIMFEVAQVAAEFMHGKSQDEICKWTAEQLRKCGYPTTPMGASWGVLDEK